MKSPQFSHFKNAETVQFTDNVLTILDKTDPEALKINPQATALKEQFQALKKLFILDQGNAITKEIQDLDSLRDDDLIGINMYVDSFLKHFQKEKKQASEILRTLLDKHGRDLYKRSYAEETAGIRSMIHEAEAEPGVTEAITTLGLNEWFAHLKSCNDLFDQKFLERNEAYAKAPKEKFAVVRIRTESAYEELARHLAAHAVISPNQNYSKVIGQIEKLVENYNQTVKGRIKKSNSGKNPVTE